MNNTVFSTNPDDYWARIVVTNDKYNVAIGGKFSSESVSYDSLLKFDDVWGVPIPGDPKKQTTFQFVCGLIAKTGTQMKQCMDGAKAMGPKKILPWTLVANAPQLNHPWAQSTCEAGDDAQSFKCTLPGSFDTQGKTAEEITDEAISLMSNNLAFAKYRGLAFWAIDSSEQLSVSPLLDFPAMLKNQKLIAEAAAKKAEEDAAVAAAAASAEAEQPAGNAVGNVRTFDEGGFCTLVPAGSPNPALLALLATAMVPMVLRRRR
ncbi:MAG: hypothetical protein WC956_09880 [bacterium]